MLKFRSDVSITFIRLFLVPILVCFICLIIGTGNVNAEKSETNLTIEISPEDPLINQSFHVTGFLMTIAGKSLGNKRVTLESSQKGGKDAEDYSFISIKDTGKDGSYDFLRQKDFPPEFLRVKYAGNDNYSPATSQVIAVKGAGTDHPQQTVKTGSIIVYSKPQGADIYVDNLKRGVTPATVGGLSEGPHTLNIIKGGYMNQSMEVYVTSKLDSSLDIEMVKIE